MNFLPRFWLGMIVAIVVSYWLVDRPLCSLIYDRQIPQQLCAILQIHHWPPVEADQESAARRGLLVQFVEWPPIITGLAPFLLLAIPLLKQGKPRDVLLLMCLSILFTFGLKNELKWVFSRDWPLTWTHNNLSWITDHAYGFQWFQGKILQGNDATGSFPSGHTAIAFASLLPVGLIYRRLLLWSVILATMEGCTMIIMDYHFLSDVLAGALVGVTCTLLMQSMVLSEKPARTEGAAL